MRYIPQVEQCPTVSYSMFGRDVRMDCQLPLGHAGLHRHGSASWRTLDPPIVSKEEYDKFFHPDDPVNHPAHYTSDPSGVECITITRHRNFNIGNAIKYLWRAGLKDSETHVQDLEKAKFYINDEIERLKNEGA